MGISLVLGLLLMGWIFWRIKTIKIPPNADFTTALRATPFVVVLMLDLLDFGLDIFSAPISWIVLGKLGLAPLRGVTVVEGALPGTQAIPLMTVTWLVVRLTKGRWRPEDIHLP
ncbi:MAG: hypothetical protein AAF629_03000 [Chloroflexota bacterium]